MGQGEKMQGTPDNNDHPCGAVNYNHCACDNNNDAADDDHIRSHHHHYVDALNDDYHVGTFNHDDQRCTAFVNALNNGAAYIVHNDPCHCDDTAHQRMFRRD